MGTIRLARVHDPGAGTAGRRFLVERLWPRGVRREDLPVDAARAGDVTLLYSARDREHDSAVVLREHLLDRLSDSFANRDES
ncbi:DUF488 domain-containing protein [Geodermatophilus sp. SYSU D00742]